MSTGRQANRVKGSQPLLGADLFVFGAIWRNDALLDHGESFLVFIILSAQTLNSAHKDVGDWKEDPDHCRIQEELLPFHTTPHLSMENLLSPVRKRTVIIGKVF